MTAVAPEMDMQARRKRLVDRLSKMTPAQRQKLLKLAQPRLVDQYLAHIPHPKQQVFLTIQAREAMFGGAAGGGKSDTLLMAALQYVDVPGYSALILRRTWPDLNSAGAILDRAKNWLNDTDAEIREGGRIWRFPSGARLSFGTLLRENDKYKYQSAEYQFVGFDELTQFEETQYTYLFSRIRRPQLACLNCGAPVRKTINGGIGGWGHGGGQPCTQPFPDPAVLAQYGSASDGVSIWDVPLRMRSATNPGGTGHEWVRDRFVNPETREESAVFVPALLTDNPSLDQDEYIKSLEHLLPTERERLMRGDWDIAEEGELFERHWFRVLQEAPETRDVVRFWDNAATSGGGDYTVGAKVRLFEGKWVIEDIIRGQFGSDEKRRLIQQTAAADGRYCPIRMEQEPGSAGVDVIDMYRRDYLVGYDFDGVKPSGDKETRATPLAVAAEAGNVYIVEGRWNKAMLDEFSMFPNTAAHDDQVDAVTGAFSYLAFGRRSRLLV